jgi:hypothetical protein
MGSYLKGPTQRFKLGDYLSESIQCHSAGESLGTNILHFGYYRGIVPVCIGDYQLFQKDLDRLGEWCRSNKFDMNAINGTALERVDEIKDLGVIIDERMLFLPHIEDRGRYLQTVENAGFC